MSKIHIGLRAQDILRFRVVGLGLSVINLGMRALDFGSAALGWDFMLCWGWGLEAEILINVVLKSI